MRIVQIANFYTPTSGGLRTCVDEIGRGYVAAGHERILVVPGRSDGDERTASGRRITVASPRLLGTGSYHVLTGRRMYGLLDAIGPDVLEISDKFSVAWLSPWARKRGVPMVLFSHERIDAILRNRVPKRFPLIALADVANKKLSQRVDQVVVTSQFAADEFARVGATNVQRVPLGVDLSTFHPNGRPDDRSAPKLVTISRLSAEKRVERAIDALRLVRASGVDAELSIVGDGPLRPKMEQRAVGLPVRFLGHISGREAIAKVVSDADIALCPSPAETFGLAVLEALACGTPVVVPREGAAHELVGARGSGAVTDGTAAGIAKGIVDLLRVPAGQRRADSRAAAERFPWSATVSGLLDLHASYV